MTITEKLADVETALRAAVDEVNSWEDPYVELYKRGVTGNPGCDTTCIVAEYLTSRIDGFEVSVAGSVVSGWIGFHETEEVPFAQHVEKFIREFDANKYPELEEDN